MFAIRTVNIRNCLGPPVRVNCGSGRITVYQMKIEQFKLISIPEMEIFDKKFTCCSRSEVFIMKKPGRQIKMTTIN